MGIYKDVELIRRQGLDPAERGFATWAIEQALDDFIYGVDLPVRLLDFGRGGSECEIADEDILAALRAPVSFAAVVADICRELKIELPELVRLALGEDCPLPLPPAA